jgi:type IV pilus assembly protein PilO
MPWYNPSEAKQRNALVVALLLLALLYPFYTFWYKGRRAEVDVMQAHLEKLTDDNRRASLTSARGGGKDLEERMALYERQVGKLEELIPAAEDVAGLLNDITTDGRHADINVSRMVPEPPEPGAFYTKSTFDMAVIGEYHHVGQFLTQIASLSRIVTPVEMDIKLYEQPNLYPDYESPIVATFRIETYVLPEPNTAPGKGATAPKPGGSE